MLNYNMYVKGLVFGCAATVSQILSSVQLGRLVSLRLKYIQFVHS